MCMHRGPRAEPARLLPLCLPTCADPPCAASFFPPLPPAPPQPLSPSARAARHSPGGCLRPPILTPPPICLTQGYGAGPQVGGGIEISGLPANLAPFNATYAPTGDLVAGYPSFSAGPTRHLHRHPEHDVWFLDVEPFDPAVDVCTAMIRAAGGPVPTGTRAWTVHGTWTARGPGRSPSDDGNWFQHEVTARQVA